jgi:hypothetical protein
MFEAGSNASRFATSFAAATLRTVSFALVCWRAAYSDVGLPIELALRAGTAEEITREFRWCSGCFRSEQNAGRSLAHRR